MHVRKDSDSAFYRSSQYLHSYLRIEIEEYFCSGTIVLSYIQCETKPPSRLGGVGLDAFCRGCITRTVNCLADEQEDDKGNRLGFFGHYSELDRDDWYSKSRIDHYIEINDGSYDLYDLMPDEFNFNFCGYSGSFYMDHKGQFVVHSSSDIKVEFNKRLDCISIFDTRDKISSKVKDINGNDGNRTNRTLINKITLVTPDGIRYEFGGINATEYSIPYFNQKDGYLYATSCFLPGLSHRKEITLISLMNRVIQ